MFPVGKTHDLRWISVIGKMNETRKQINILTLIINQITEKMKKTLRLIASAIVVLCVMASCGSSKVGLGKELQKSPAQVYAEKNTKTRAWGKGVDVNESIARNMADLEARGKITKAIESTVNVLLENYNDRYDKTIANSVNSGEATDGKGTYKEDVRLAARQIVKGFREVESNAYLQDNGEVAVYVCLEYDGGESAFFEQIAEKTFDKVIKGQIPEEDEEKIDEARKEFIQEMSQQIDLGK